MLTDLRTCVRYELEDTEKYKEFDGIKKTVSLATGYAAQSLIEELAKELQTRFSGLSVNVYPIKNNFFGESITVSGLLTGKDITEQLVGKELGEVLFIPSSALRAEGDVLLDDVSPEDISRALSVRVSPLSNEAEAFILNILKA